METINKINIVKYIDLVQFLNSHAIILVNKRTVMATLIINSKIDSTLEKGLA